MMISCCKKTLSTDKILILLLALVAFGISALGAAMPFMLDDFLIIDLAKDNLSGGYNWHKFIDFLLLGHLREFMPLRNLLDLGTYFIFGIGSAAPYHLLLAIFHVIVTLCCWKLAMYLTGNKPLAFLSAFIFAIFPYHYMSIWWIANIGNPLTFFCFLFAFFSFIKWVEGKDGHLLISAFFWTTLSLFASYQGAIYPLSLLAYIFIFPKKVKKGIFKIFTVFSFIFMLDFLCFIFRQHYATEGGGIVKNILLNLTNFWPRILMFDIFTNPQMPLKTAVTIAAISLYSFILFFEILRNRSRIKTLFGSLALMIGLFLLFFGRANDFIKYLSLIFFFYYLVFGNQIERFSVLLIFIFSLIFLTVGTGMFSDRYLYTPNFAFSILLSSIITRNLQGLSIKKYFKGILLTTLLLGFIFMSAIFYYDKFWDWFSVSNLEWQVIQEVAKTAPEGAKVVHANSTTLFNLDIPIKKWFGRRDLEVYEGFGVPNQGFFLGSAYFINFNNLKLLPPDSRFSYAAERFYQIRLKRTSAFLYDWISAVFFSDGLRAYFTLEANAEITGIVVNRNQPAKLMLTQEGSSGNADDIEIRVNNEPLQLSRSIGLEGDMLVREYRLPATKEFMKISIRNRGDKSVRIHQLKYVIE